jgi:hypothetical protein
MSHGHNLRTRLPHQRSSAAPRPSRRRHQGTMATAQDAIDAMTAVGNRIDAVQLGQTNITTQLANIKTQLAALIGVQTAPGLPAAGVAASIPVVQPTTRRRLDPSTLEKLHGDVSISLLRSWRNRWDDYAALNQLSSYPAAEQMTALRMCLDPSMQQVVEIVLGISPATPTTPDDVLDCIGNHVREKRNVALDRVAFEERRQGPAESFGDFYISLRRLTDPADICGTCFDGRMATRIMAGVRDSETKKKLLALSPFPTAQTAVNLCRSEESARANEKILSQTAVASIQTRQSGKHLPSSSPSVMLATRNW